VTTRDATRTNGSIEKPPFATSSAPSSDKSPVSLPPSIPTIVQYDCWPEKPRGK